MAVFIFPSEENALLDLFCHEEDLFGWIGQVTSTIYLD